MSDFIPNSFQCPNVLIDRLMCILSGSEFKCLVTVLRKTRGWHKDVDGIAIGQFQCLTGIKDKKTIYKAIDSLVERGLLQVKRSTGHTNLYQLSRLFYEGKPAPVDKPVPKNGTSTKNPHLPVPKNGTSTSTKNWHSTKDNKKQINKRQAVDNFSSGWDKPHDREKPVPPMPKDSDNKLIEWAVNNGFSKPRSGESWYDYRGRLIGEYAIYQADQLKPIVMIK